MKKKIEFLAIWLVVTGIHMMPLNMSRHFADFIAYIVRDVLRIRRSVVDENLRRAFPDWEDERRERVSNECYRFFARAAVDWLKADDVLESESVDITGGDRLDRLSKEGGILVTGHLGYWELSAILVVRRIGRITVYADRQSNPHSERLIERQRNRHGVQTASGSTGVRRLAKDVNAGGVIGIVGDQRPRNQPEYVPFFGSLVRNTRVLSFVARITQSKVLPLSVRRSSFNRLEFRIEKPLPASLERVTKENRSRLLTQYNRWLEKRIPETPEQYFWLHRRWKNSRPIDEGEKRAS